GLHREGSREELQGQRRGEHAYGAWNGIYSHSSYSAAGRPGLAQVLRIDGRNSPRSARTRVRALWVGPSILQAAPAEFAAASACCVRWAYSSRRWRFETLPISLRVSAPA